MRLGLIEQAVERCIFGGDVPDDGGIAPAVAHGNLGESKTDRQLGPVLPGHLEIAGRAHDAVHAGCAVPVHELVVVGTMLLRDQHLDILTEDFVRRVSPHGFRSLVEEHNTVVWIDDNNTIVRHLQSLLINLRCEVRFRTKQAFDEGKHRTSPL